MRRLALCCCAVVLAGCSKSKEQPPEDAMADATAAPPAPAGSASAQDAVAVDPKHYKVEFENEQVRVLRISYGPGEKSVMHEHPASVAVFLTGAQAKFTTPDGKSQEATVKTGTTMWGDTGKHLPENVGDKPFELILVELKGKAAPAK